MKYKTLFRLVVKAVGLFMFLTGLGPALGLAVSALYDWFNPLVPGYSMARGLLPTAVGSAISSAFGLYLFFGGRWVVNLAIPGNHPYCPECAYDLTGAESPRCPECGTPFRRDDVTPLCPNGASGKDASTVTDPAPPRRDDGA